MEYAYLKLDKTIFWIFKRSFLVEEHEIFSF